MGETKVDKNSFKERFLLFGAILGFLVDIKTLWDLLPFGINIDGKIVFTPVTGLRTIVTIGAFEMNGQVFTGFIGIIILVFSLSAVILYRINVSTMKKPLTVFGILVIRLVNYLRLPKIFGWFFLQFSPYEMTKKEIIITNLFSHMMLGLTILWLLTFYPITNINLIFLIIIGWSIPLLGFVIWNSMTHTKFMPESSFFVFLMIFGGTIIWVVLSFLQIGFFHTNIGIGFLLTLITIILGYLIFKLNTLLADSFITALIGFISM